MNPVNFLPTPGVTPWCPHIKHGILQPTRYPQFKYSHGWVVQGVKGRYSNPVPHHWRYCPICIRPRPITHQCPVTHRGDL